MEQLLLTQKRIANKYQISAQILIVDDGSTDQTCDILKQYYNNPKIHIIHHPVNYGYGRTLKTGFQFAIKKNFSWVISFDMDGQHEPTCLYRFISQILKSPSHIGLISGSRYLDPTLFWRQPWKDRYLVNAVVSGVLSKLDINVTDAFCGMKAFRTNELAHLQLELDGYEMPLEFWIKYNQNQYDFIELPVPVIYKDRREVHRIDFTEIELIENALNRIKKYLNTLEEFSSNRLIINLPEIYELFRVHYNQFNQISADNYKDCWKKIVNATQKLITRKPINEEIRCSCGRCPSGRC